MPPPPFLFPPLFKNAGALVATSRKFSKLFPDLEQEGNRAGGGRRPRAEMDSPAPPEKVVVLLKATGDAPILKQSKFKVLKSESFVFISEFLRKNLKLDSVVSWTSFRRESESRRRAMAEN